MGPDCLEGGTEGELLEVWEKSEALFSKKASAAGTEVPAPDLEPQGGQMHIEPTPLGRADAVGGEATDSVSEPPAQDESVSAAQSAAEAEAERLRENLRMMSEMMARLQDKVLATCGQTTEEFAEVQRLLEKNESLLHQPLALEQGHGSRNAAGLVSEGALVEWQSGEIDREGVEGERGGDVGSCESEPDGATFEKGVPVEANAPEMFVNGVTGLQSTDSEVRGAVGRSNPLQAKAPVAATFADVQPAEGPSTLGKEGPIVTPQQELEGRVDEGGLVLPGLEEEPGVPSSKGSVSGDSLTAGGVTAGVSGSPSEATTAAEGLHSSPEFEDLPGVSFNPKTPAKTDLTAWGGAAESLDAPSREVSQSASEVLSTAGPNANTHSGVNGHLSENGHLSLSALPTLEPFDDDEGSGLEDNDDGFDSEPEEAPLAEEEQIAVVPMVVPLLFSESDEEEGGGSTKPDGVSLEGLSSREGSVREPEVVMERVKKTVKGPGKQRLAGGSKGKKGHSGRAEKGGRGGEIKSKGTRGEGETGCPFGVFSIYRGGSDAVNSRLDRVVMVVLCLLSTTDG